MPTVEARVYMPYEVVAYLLNEYPELELTFDGPTFMAGTDVLVRDVEKLGALVDIEPAPDEWNCKYRARMP